MTKTSSAAVVAAASLACAQIAAAQVWTGNAPKIGDVTLWTAPANWQTNSVPGDGAGVVFGNGFASGLTINPVGNRHLSELWIDTSASFSIVPVGTPSTLTLSYRAERRESASGTQTISTGIYLPKSFNSWNIYGTGGGLVLDGAITTYAGNAAVDDIGAPFIKNGTALLTLRGATSTIGGTLALTQGPMLITGNANVTAGNSAVPNSPTLYVDSGALTLNGAARLNTKTLAWINRGGSVAVSGTGTEWSHNAVGADVDVGANGVGTLSVSAGGRVTIGNELRLGAGGTGTVNVTTTNNVATNLFTNSLRVATGDGNGTFNMSGNGAVAIVGAVNVGGASANGRTAAINVNSDAVMFADAVYLGVESATTVNGGQIRTGEVGLRAGVSNATVTLQADATFGSAFVFDTDRPGAATTVADGVVFTGNGTFEKAGGGTLTLNRTTGIRSNLLVRGGTLQLADGLDAASGSLSVWGGSVSAAKVVNRRLAGGAGRVTATGTLLIGDATIADGVNYGGTIAVGNHSVLLMDADRAHVSAVTIANNGRLNSFAGLQVNGSVAATGNATIDGTFFNNGTVNGPTTAGQWLTFVDDVSGAGAYTGNVRFSDGFSPGNSPANVTLGTAAFDNSTSLTMELAGTAPGTGYDRLTVTGGLALDGSLDVVLLAGFVPQLGQSFTLIDGPITGAFDGVTLPALASGLTWQTTQTAAAYTITVAAVPEPMSLGLIAAGASLLARRRRR